MPKKITLSRPISLGLGAEAVHLKPGNHILDDAQFETWYIQSLISSGAIIITGEIAAPGESPQLSMDFGDSDSVSPDLQGENHDSAPGADSVKESSDEPKEEDPPVAEGDDEKKEDPADVVGAGTKEDSKEKPAKQTAPKSKLNRKAE